MLISVPKFLLPHIAKSCDYFLKSIFYSKSTFSRMISSDTVFVFSGLSFHIDRHILRYISDPNDLIRKFKGCFNSGGGTALVQWLLVRSQLVSVDFSFT